jgi:class 3 adenylate cyclase
VTDHAEVVGSTPEGSDLGTKRKRKPRTLRFRLAFALIAVALLSVLFLGLINYNAARKLLNGAVELQLNSLQAARTQTIGNELSRVKGEVAAIATDHSVVDAMRDLTAGYRDLAAQPDLLQPDEVNELEDFYRDASARFAAAGYEPPPLDELVPSGPAARYLQYHYLVENPFPPDQRNELVAADDGSAYTRAHRDHHEALSGTAADITGDDLLLISRGGDATVVYSSAKRTDFATDLVSGPYRDSGLAEAVNTQLATVPVGETILVDFEPYVPAGGQPVMFAASAVRDNAEVIGAVAVAVPIDRINAVTTAGGNWDELALGKTGETYVVGGDRLMRSDSRLWLEDPDAYLTALADAGYAPDLAERIVRNDSTVLAQPIDTPSVRAGLEGRSSADVEENYLGEETLTVAGPLGFDKLDWVVVAGLAKGEADNALNSYLRKVLLVALILVPVVAVVAIFSADRLTRPVEPVIDAAERVAAGDLNSEAPDLGRNEYGDLANRINHLTAQLREDEAALAARERDITDVLLAALPPRLVDQARKGERSLGDVIDTGTVIALSFSGLFDEESADQELGIELSSLLSRKLEEIADHLGIERVRSSSDEHMFTAGLRSPGIAANDAAQFIEEIRSGLERFAEETGAQPTYRAGLCAGEIATGLQAGNQLSYGVWGESPRVALALNAIAAPGETLLDESVASALGSEWDLERADGLVDLSGDPIRASLLLGRRHAENVPEAST